MGLSAVAEQITDLKEHMEMLTSPILTEVKKTNGRVTSLEGWRGNMQGAWRVVTWVGIPLFGVYVGFMSWLAFQVVNIDKTVAEELDSREFIITP
jgi:hypothetical protein